MLEQLVLCRNFFAAQRFVANFVQELIMDNFLLKLKEGKISAIMQMGC
jgi:hypothetical protein